LFGNYEEFIPISLGEIAQQSWHDDRTRLRALTRFGEEEMKHQQLFLRAEAVMEASCGYSFGRYFDPGKQRVTAFTDAVVQFPLLPRFLLLTAFEWGSQLHYVESVRDRDGDQADPLYLDMLKNHWIEENQHTKTDVLEIARMAEGMSAGELADCFERLQEIAALVDETLVGQVDEEIGTLERVHERSFSDTERTALREALYHSMNAIWVEVSLSHPRFVQLATELSREGSARLGIV
jgi:transposase